MSRRKEPGYDHRKWTGDTVILGLQDYYQMKAEIEMLRTLAEAEEDVAEGRVAPIQSTFDDIRNSLLKREQDEI